MMDSNHKRKNMILILAVVIMIMAGILFAFAIDGRFAIDEFYSISSADLSFSSSYDRSPYINNIVGFVSGIFGRSYWDMKAIPISVSVLCALLFMLFLYRTVRNSSFLMVVGTIAFSFNARLLFNHFYIRFYVFEELAFLSSSFFVYTGFHQSKKLTRIVYYSLAMIPVLLYYTLTNDYSGLLLLLVVMFSIILCIVYRNNPKLLNRYTGIIFVAFCVLLATGFAILKGNKTLRDKILGEYSYITGFLADERYYVMDKYFVYAYAAALIMFAVYMYVACFKSERTVQEIRGNDVFPLFIMAVIPMLIYATAFGNNYLTRTFTPYVPVIIVFTMASIDSCISDRRIQLALSALVLIGVVGSYDHFDVKSFWDDPAIRGETWFGDYYTGIKRAEELYADGSEVTTMFINENIVQFFDLNDYPDITYYNERNELKYSYEERDARFDAVLNSETPSVLVGDFYGMLQFKDDYGYWLYDRYDCEQYDAVYVVHID